MLTPPERMHANYDLAKTAETLERYPLAIEHYRAALALIGTNANALSLGMTINQVLGTRQRLAFCLHEDRQFAEARTLNEQLIAAATTEFGPDDPRLSTALINLAQNDYELHDHPAAQATLERLLAIATKAGDTEHVDTALFQLAVLAFEDGDTLKARRLMTKRIDLARTESDEAMQQKAEQDLAVLEQKSR